MTRSLRSFVQRKSVASYAQTTLICVFEGLVVALVVDVRQADEKILDR